jgi:lipoate-protein ligase A
VHQEVLRSIQKEDGGLIRVAAKVDVGRRILRDVLITGDFFIRPQRSVYDLEAALKHRRLEDLDETVRRFFADSPIPCSTSPMIHPRAQNGRG